LRYLNPWIRSNRLHNPSGKIYEIRIPNDTFFNYEKLKEESKYIFDIDESKTFNLYRAGDNENVESIAKKYGLDPETLETLNHLHRKNNLPKGTLIIIPHPNKN
jgi:hypothetical protein